MHMNIAEHSLGLIVPCVTATRMFTGQPCIDQAVSVLLLSPRALLYFPHTCRAYCNNLSTCCLTHMLARSAQQPVACAARITVEKLYRQKDASSQVMVCELMCMTSVHLVSSNMTYVDIAQEKGFDGLNAYSVSKLWSWHPSCIPEASLSTACTLVLSQLMC